MKDLVQRLEEANEAYRNGEPTMTDAAFDALENQLREKDPAHPWFNKTGAPAPVDGQWPKVKHSIPMRSLLKAQTDEDLRAWWPGHPCVITEKLDGISCFEGDTPIHLANGETVPIREIVEQDMRPRVLTWDAQVGVTTEKVVNAFDNGIRDNWVRLTFEDGSCVTVTEDHPFYVQGEGWVSARDLEGKNTQTIVEDS